jgi:hypothetical protein
MKIPYSQARTIEKSFFTEEDSGSHSFGYRYLS